MSIKYLIYDWLGLNHILFYKLNHISNLWMLPCFFNIMSQPFKLFVFLLYYILLIVYKFQKLKHFNFKYEEYIKSFNELVKIGSIYAALGIVYAGLKYLINLPRPYCSLSQFSSIQNFENVRCLSSFPSAHTAIAILVCYIFWPYLKNTGKILCAILVLLVGLSRISLAMHFPSDILYSILIILLIIYVVEKILQSKLIQNYIVTPVANKIFRYITQ